MKQLSLSRTNRKLAGVCGGFGEYFNIDPTVVRVAVVLVCVVTAILPVVIAYVACMLIIPDSDTPGV
jgi:phage shock protein PspC (stress-responsive transcriptional regulator)